MPRHIALHPNGTWLYSINEIAGGASGYTGLKSGSEIDIAPAGDLLFVSMRLDNAAEGSLVSYMVNPTRRGHRDGAGELARFVGDRDVCDSPRFARVAIDQ